MNPTDDELLVRLNDALVGEVDGSARRRAEYSTDASTYRVLPRPRPVKTLGLRPFTRLIASARRFQPN